MNLSWRLLNRSEHAPIFIIYCLLIKLLLTLIVRNLKVAIELLKISIHFFIFLNFLMIILSLSRILPQLFVLFWRQKLAILYLNILLLVHGFSSVWRRLRILGLSFLQ